jgi:hypothetical protein
MQTWAVEIKLRAERKAGELLAALDLKKHGRKKTGDTKDTRSLLPDGISRKQSSKWQKTARIPESKFEAIIAKAKAEKIVLRMDPMNRREARPSRRRDERWDFCYPREISCMGLRGDTD